MEVSPHGYRKRQQHRNKIPNQRYQQQEEEESSDTASMISKEDISSFGGCGFAPPSMPSRLPVTIQEWFEQNDIKPPPDSVPGNIYRFWGLGLSTGGCIGPAALFFIIVIQIIAPILILYWAVWSLKDQQVKFGLGDWKYVAWSQNSGLSHIGQRYLGLFFLFCFVANAYKTIQKEKEAWVKVKTITVHFPQWDYCTFWLEMGPIVNSLVLLICCVDMLFLMARSDDPKELVFDSLGLLFLSNLDDVDNGGLNFLTQQLWPAEALGALWLPQGVTTPPGVMWDKPLSSPACAHQITEMILGIFVVLIPFLYCFLEGLELRSS